MNKKQLLLCMLVLATAELSFACSDQSTATNQANKVQETKGKGNEALSSAVSERIKKTLKDYEAIREALAADRLNDVAGIATRLEASAEAAKKEAPPDVTSRLNEMKSATANLKAGGDADAPRKTFGDLSRAVVSLLVEHRALSKNRYIFECPMAQGYKKWIQTKKELENPYMGGRMLKCGSASKWSI